MGASAIAVDLLNPGQVFACLGLMEITEVLSGSCVGYFDVTARATRGLFRFETSHVENPMTAVVRFVSQARVRAISPEPSKLRAKEDGVETDAGGPVFPAPRPRSPSALPAVLINGPHSIPISHWADNSSRDKVKLWAGAGGYSGAALTRDLLDSLKNLDEVSLVRAHDDPFSLDAPMTSSFRFDWRRDYVPMDVGFSPNNHQRFEMVGFPLVELLAAIGLQNARPFRLSRRDKLNYRYGVWTAEMPTPLARAVLGGQGLGFPYRRFRMRLGWPGQEDQARCIVDAREESVNDEHD